MEEGKGNPKGLAEPMVQDIGGCAGSGYPNCAI
jgi:hypothetical protein